MQHVLGIIPIDKDNVVLFMQSLLHPNFQQIVQDIDFLITSFMVAFKCNTTKY